MFFTLLYLFSPENNGQKKQNSNLCILPNHAKICLIRTLYMVTVKNPINTLYEQIKKKNYCTGWSIYGKLDEILLMEDRRNETLVD